MKIVPVKGNEYNIPFIPQYEDYEYNTDMFCDCCSDFTPNAYLEGIVGISEDANGRYLLLHKCPRCGAKWRCHIVGSDRNNEYAITLLGFMLDKCKIELL